MHLVLLLPNKQSREALGTYSGIRPRGILRLRRSRIATVVKMRNPRKAQVPRSHRSKPQPQSVCLADVRASFDKIPAKVRKRQRFYSTKKYLGARNTLLRKPAYMSRAQVKKGKLPTEHFQGIQRLWGKARDDIWLSPGV